MLTISREANDKADSGLKQRHLPALDGLRGVAILLVLAGHFYQRIFFSSEPGIAMVFGRLAGAGGYGVELFFVLSGFLITGILLDNKDSPGSLRKFYVRRCLRIFPLYYLALTVIFVALPHFVEFDAGAQTIARQQLWVWTYLVNWPSVGWIWDDSHIFLIGHFWTLCVEEHFYVFWPIVVYLLTRRNLTRSCLFLVGVGLVSRLASALMGADCPTVLQWPTLQKIDGLAIGSFLAIAVRDARMRADLPDRQSFRRAVLILGIMAIWLVGMPRWMRTDLVGVFSETIIAALCGLVVLSTIRSKGEDYFGRILRSTVIRTFGKYSYGLYVIHGILRPQFAKLIGVEPQWPMSAGPAILYQFAYYVMAIGLSFVLAYASFHLFEKHFLAMKRYVAYGVERQQ
jgi:peptidoglycan/LPS O-acetylase OafA/YrhL